ncbi:hypothetical protein [Streptomyces sp. NPDC088254]|uniref:hypothetical protein n=1 Tax=Streptomyces sp. NPDC088254 TaxID=3365847 RepID=UPI0038165E17
MTNTTAARERLLNLISPTEAASQDTTPENAVDDAIHEALFNQPALRNCLVPGCLKQYDSIATMTGMQPARPEWSGQGWATLGSGTIFPAGGHICPDHKDIVTAHWPRRVQLPNDRWSVDCACEWTPAPQRWHGVLRALWEQHLLTELGKLPPAPPIPEPAHRIPLEQHTEGTLTELYDRVEDAEADQQDTRDVMRAAMLGYTTAVPALLGVKASLEALRTRLTLDSRDWTADKLDALLWAVLVGWNCENTEPGHVHDDNDCTGDQGLWNIAKRHGIPTDQTIHASQHRWWVANAIKVAKQIEETNPH